MIIFIKIRERARACARSRKERYYPFASAIVSAWSQEGSDTSKVRCNLALDKTE